MAKKAVKKVTTKAKAKAPAKAAAKPAKPAAAKAKKAAPAKTPAKATKPAKVAAAKAPAVEKTAPTKAEKPAKAAKAPKALKKEKVDKTSLSEGPSRWIDLYNKYKSEKPQVYNMSAQFEANKPIQHKVLGWGYVLSNENDRLEVLFEQGIKLLISNYKTA